MEEDNPQQQMERGLILCQIHFGRAWSGNTGCRGGCTIEPLSGGLSNFLYVASLPENSEPQNGEPKKVLLRFYGTSKGNHGAILKDSLVFALLAVRGLGPKLYGCFPGGRFEEYIPARSLLPEELAYPNIMEQVATALANFHNLEMPLAKDPNHVKVTIFKDLAILKNNWNVLLLNPTWKEIQNLNINFEEELQWLDNVFRSSSLEVRFCHNDTHGGNILKEKATGELMLIDYEYSAYNYRGFDLAKYFLGCCYTYGSPDPPYFREHLESYPSIEQQRKFFYQYLVASGAEPTEKAIQKLYLETQLLMLGVHFETAFWAIRSKFTAPDIRLDHLVLALVRLRSYKTHKEFLHRAYPSLIYG